MWDVKEVDVGGAHLRLRSMTIQGHASTSPSTVEFQRTNFPHTSKWWNIVPGGDFSRAWRTIMHVEQLGYIIFTLSPDLYYDIGCALLPVDRNPSVCDDIPTDLIVETSLCPCLM